MVPIYKDVKRAEIVANYFKKVLVSNEKGRSGGIENYRGCAILKIEEGRELDLLKIRIGQNLEKGGNREKANRAEELFRKG